MFRKGCSRCGGDLHVEPDLVGRRSYELVCLQCGYSPALGEREALLARRAVSAGRTIAGATAKQRPAA